MGRNTVLFFNNLHPPKLISNPKLDGQFRHQFQINNKKHGNHYQWPNIKKVTGVKKPTYRGIMTPFKTGSCPPGSIELSV